MNIIDTHSHVLPLVDHGSPDIETTVRMIRAAAELGTTAICCTPHMYEYDAQLVARARETLGEVGEALDAAGISVRLLLGFELDLTVAATSDTETLRSLCIGGNDKETAGRALLVEMPFADWPPFLEETIFRLSSRGLTPIIAHPERNDRVQRSPDVLTPCMNAGAVLQGTAGSLSSLFRKESQKTFYQLLARGWYGLLASDAHATVDYTWSLGPLLAELDGRISAGNRELLVEINPMRVLEGKRPLPLPAERPTGKRRGLFR